MAKPSTTATIDPPTHWLKLYGNRRMGVLALLGFASGLPYMLTSDAMVAWLSKPAQAGGPGVDVATIGLFGQAALPYSLKFLWAPLLDRYALPVLGRRRGWLLLMQLLTIAGIIAMAMIDPGRRLWPFFAAATLLAFFSATQDIVADAYRTDVLQRRELGAGAAVFVNGYKLATILAGGGAMVLASYWNWPLAYLSLAALMGVGLIGTWLAPEPEQTGEPAPTLSLAVIMPLREFAGRTGRAGVAVLLLVLLFKLPDVTANWQTIPFLKSLGYGDAQIGLVRQLLGIVVTMIGAMAGGWMVGRLGLLRSLWVIGILQAVSNAGFLALNGLNPTQAGTAWWTMSLPWGGQVIWGPALAALTAVITVESFCGGLVTAGYMAFLMSQCNRRFSASQYALLTSLMALTAVIFRAPTGYLVNWLGWSGFFLTTIGLAIPGLAMLVWIGRSGIESPHATLRSRD